MSLKPITDYCKHKAVFFDLHGHFVGIKTLKWKEESFAFKERLYNFIPDKSFKLRYWFSSTKYYFYNIDNSMPICLNGENKGIIDPVAYKRILETDLIKKLNALSSNGIFAWLMQPKVLIVIAVLIAVALWFGSGHTPQEAINYVSGQG